MVLKILSYNVRVLGDWEKRREVQRLVREKNQLMFCIQETKLQVFVDFFVVHYGGLIQLLIRINHPLEQKAAFLFFGILMRWKYA